MDDPRNGERSSWYLRRKIVFGTLYYCAVAVAYLVLFGEDTALNAQLAIALTGLAGMVIGSYVFGAVWEDKTKIRSGMWPTSTPSFPRPAPVIVQDCDELPPRAHQGDE